MKIFLRMTLLLALASCGASKDESAAVNPDVMSGVAATGAPISNGKVEIKGASGGKKSTTTAADGSYSSNIGTLAEPYLVRVIAPTGEKYITVSSKSALAAGKKVNITPLTHTIVANVFQESDADTLFDDFVNQSGEFTEVVLETEKGALVQKLKDAGLLGAGKIADEAIDLLNGSLQAGTSTGIDGLLDVIDVNTNNVGGAGIKITLKASGTAIITDKVDGSTDATPTAVSGADLSAAQAQLTVIDQLRTALSNFASTYSSYAACNEQNVIDDAGSCDIDTITAAIAVHMHPSWSDQGKSGSATVGAYDWVCGEDFAIVNKTTCLAATPTKKYEFQSASFTDVSLISYDVGTEVAHINFNLYLNGAYRGLNELRFKKDSGTFKLFGGEQTFGYWVGSESIHQTVYDVSAATSTENYGVSLNMYLKSNNLSLTAPTTLTFTASSGNNVFANGTATNVPVYIVSAPVYDESNNCTAGVTFSATASPWVLATDGTTTSATCSTGGVCACTSHYFDWESNRLKLTASDIGNMSKMERIVMTGTGIGGTDAFYIRRPLVINQFNATDYEPNIGVSIASFCNSQNTADTFSITSPTDTTLEYASLWYGYQYAGPAWGNVQAQKNYSNSSVTSSTFNPNDTSYSNYFNFGGNTPTSIDNKNFWLSSRDSFERKFVRRIECQP